MKYERACEDVLIRPVDPDDASQIVEVLYRAWLTTYPNPDVGITEADIHAFFKDLLTRDEIERRVEKIRNLSEDVIYRVAETCGKVIGFAILRKYPDFDQLQAIYVDPKHQGKGVGTILYNALDSHVEKNLIVHVATYNQRAIRFYEQLGFIDTGKRFTEERHRMPVSGMSIPEMELVRVRVNAGPESKGRQ